MKFTIAALLLGATTAVQMAETTSGEVTAEQMPEGCDGDEKIDEQTLLDFEEDPQMIEIQAGDDAPATSEALETMRRYVKKVRGSARAHYGKTWSKINAENRHILGTQSKCLRFVRRHPGHRAVCNYCKRQKVPKVIWRWDKSQQVWYRWSHYNRKWMYWGPSIRGFTSSGWSYYRGYWHHGGFAFRYVRGRWYRFQNRRWVYYSRTVPVKPGKPKARKECRAFYKRMKAGFSAKLAEKKLPRCQVGKHVYMWTGEANCRFLGGRFVYLRRHTCKSHTNDQWRRVVRCVYEPTVTGKGLFVGLRKVSLLNRAKVTSKRKGHLARKLLNSRTDRKNTFDDHGVRSGWVKVRFNSHANIDGLGVITGKWDSVENPNYFHVIIKYKDRRGRRRQHSVIRRPIWPNKRMSEKRLWTGHVGNVYEIDYFFQNSRKKSLHISVLTFYQQKGSRLPKLGVRRSFYGRGLFDSNRPPKAKQTRRTAYTYRDSATRDAVWYCNNKGYVDWTGSAIKALPDKNFQISMSFHARDARAGFFMLHGNGHDRHIGLSGGRVYVRVYKGRGWTANTRKRYNDSRWHKLVLRVQTGRGQRLYVDGKLIGTNKYDHSDFNWKSALRLCYSSDLGYGKRTYLKNVIYRKI